MTNPTPHGQVPEALRLADEISKAGAFPAYPRAPYEAAAAELRRLHAQVAALTAAPQGVAYAELPEPTPDELRAIARVARNSSGSASDDCGSAAYVLYGWRAAIRASHGQAPAKTGNSVSAQADSVQEDAARYRFLRDGEWRDTDLEPFIRLQLNTLWDAKIDAARAAQGGKDA